jgi:hypothetical protein
MPEVHVPQAHAPNDLVTRSKPLQSVWRWGLYLVVAAVCTLVFGLYLRPDMMVTLTEQLWACF